ncbi:MAG: ADP-ribosylation factor-like protein [Candidatus Hodarchaeota archaeon]
MNENFENIDEESPKDSEHTKKIIFTGLDNSGKSSIILALQRNVAKIATLSPTRLVDRTLFEYMGYNIVRHDLGGQKKYLISYLKNPEKYFDHTAVCIYVIDIRDMARFNESLSYFEDVLEKFQELDLEPLIYVFFHKSENILLSTDKYGEEEIEKLKEEIKKMNDIRFKLEFKITTIFDLWSISSAFSDVMLNLYPRSVLLDKKLQEFGILSNYAAFLLLDKNSLTLAQYYQNDEAKEILNASTPYFLTLLDSWKPFKTIQKKQMKVLLNNYNFLFFELNYHTPLYFLVMAEFPIEVEKLNDFSKEILNILG